MTRGYYLDGAESRFIVDLSLVSFGYLLKSKSETDALEYLQQSKINYFLWTGYPENFNGRMLDTRLPNGSPEYADLTLNNYKKFIKFKNKYLELVTQQGDYYLYKLKDNHSNTPLLYLE